MDLQPGLRLSFEERPSAQDREFVNNALGHFNAPFLRDPVSASIGVFVRNPANEIRAGLTGHVYAGWLGISLLWVHKDLRRSGIGRALMAKAERRAASFGCHSAWVDTFSFQAPGFYQRLGYREFGRIDYPPDHQRLFFQKQLGTG